MQPFSSNTAFSEFAEPPSKGLKPIEDLKNLDFYKALRHQVVERLMKAIFLNELPAGTRLVVKKLAEHFGLSTTPVREALLELEAIGLVQSEHNRGAVVKPFGNEQLREIYQMRRILEAEAARAACGRIDKERLKALRRERRQLFGKSRRDQRWGDQNIDSDRRFHEMITASCGSERLAREIHRYDALVQALRDVTFPKMHPKKLASDEHLGIIDALLADDAEAASAKMAHHIDHAADSVEYALFPQKK
jgi:DNA-binding GntR family transcriptional regulator